MLTNQKQFLYRLYFVASILVVLALGIGYRIFDIQFLEGEKYRTIAKEKTIKNFIITPKRGNIYSDDGSSVHAECTLADLRQMIGLVDAAVVAIAVAISEKLGVSHTAQLVNAACECILAASSSDSFVLSRDELVDRIGEMAWNLQVSKR